MNLLLNKSTVNKQSLVNVTGSKSETNRLLLLQALYPNIQLENISKSDDSDAMQMALLSKENTIDIHHAGTAMRFLTAYFSTQEGREVILTGSSRMQERPIKILVEALQQLGAEILYEKEEGFPPIRIKGKKITANKVTLKADVSSQYISALLLIAPKLENGLELTLEGEITSIPYIEMTLALLNEIGAETTFENNKILVKPIKESLPAKRITIESDWSSVSYFYSIVALSSVGTQITVSSYKQNSLQGDSVLQNIYKDFGVKTEFNSDNSITISKITMPTLQTVTHNLKNCPDIAQTIAVTCFGLGMSCNLTGLHTLKIKETDRLEALKTELSKLSAIISVTNDSLTIEQSNNPIIKSSIVTYQDHRMAMAFAPLALRIPIIINEAEVVSKSFPTFWKDLQTIGFQVEEMK
ncbi:3-phosphoshikimate 1-carboxyvinyltransferase [Flavobacterium jejuense]|uniref:3-phosphoshikimate 1-carboxyvinyltransferase n=1 Tax=Flavobacterium jejuense TaxID=1544455 RepID=A0ABX0IUS5_9FLAO|nr:3-phosphoshikimate 1-carboxyvinyltransferase [Flavobacterium jejuense]NHN27665.1 3-phosphoshikimate 1-carboxyvinyltransferase [Flavobacterium jejuense]